MSLPRILPYSNNQMRAMLKMQNNELVKAHQQIFMLEQSLQQLADELRKCSPEFDLKCRQTEQDNKPQVQNEQAKDIVP
jgi:hypothetical protein